ncbi:MAG: hypothetical protein FWB86_09320 [Treponema sp.]|nr:hypothetical protein [Treponema sp.]MCL2245382.1 hypothetical protein [Treponema sp.]
MKKMILCLTFILMCSAAFAQHRSFDDIFPNARDILSAASGSGYVRSSQRANGFIIVGNRQGSGLAPQIINEILARNPGYLVESISVIAGTPGSVSLLDIYNAISNIRGLRGRTYSSATRNQDVPLFEEATRIVSQRQTNAIPDPPAAVVLPQSETVYLRLRDANFGNTFYRGDMSIIQNGLRYTMSNFRSMTYLLIPVIREDRFVAQMYFEPIQEGVLVYSIAGADISDFFASRIHVESAISKRLAVITEWAADGIRDR